MATGARSPPLRDRACWIRSGFEFAASWCYFHALAQLLAHGLGPQRGGKVDVGDDGAQQRVAHAAADETRLLARRIERREAGLHARPRQEAGRAVRDQRRGKG